MQAVKQLKKLHEFPVDKVKKDFLLLKFSRGQNLFFNFLHFAMVYRFFVILSHHELTVGQGRNTHIHQRKVFVMKEKSPIPKCNDEVSWFIIPVKGGGSCVKFLWNKIS